MSDQWEKSTYLHIASLVSSSLITSILLSAGASDTADTLFQEVLGRKDKADSTRNALNVLQRFKFLFNLPLNIERNIQKVPTHARCIRAVRAAAYDTYDQCKLYFLQLCGLKVHMKDIKYMCKGYIIMRKIKIYISSK